MKIKTLALSTTLILTALGTAYALQNEEVDNEISNSQGTQTCYPDALYDPNSIEGVQEVVRDALLQQEGYDWKS